MTGLRLFAAGLGGGGGEQLVRAVVLEPTRRCHRGILSPLRLPVPPRPHAAGSGGYLARLARQGKWDIPLGNDSDLSGLARPFDDRPEACSNAYAAKASIPSRRAALGNLNRVGLPRSDVRFAIL